MPRVIVTKEVRFEAAHRLPYYDGPCRELHGHSYRLVIAAAGQVNPDTGILVDFYELQAIVQAEVLDRLDHKDLNDTIENPTAENIAVYIWGKLAPKMPELHEIQLYETADSCVIYRGE